MKYHGMIKNTGGSCRTCSSHSGIVAKAEAEHIGGSVIIEEDGYGRPVVRFILTGGFNGGPSREVFQETGQI